MDTNEMRAGLESIKDEMGKLAELDELNEQDEARFTELSDSFDTLKTKVKRAEEIRRIQTQAAELGGMLPGDNSGDPEAGLAAPNVKETRNDPFDLTELRGMPAAETRSELRARAYDAIEALPFPEYRSTVKADDIRKKVTGMVENGNATVARHILTLGSPAYRRAYEKAAAGQENRWTAEEMAAVEAVEEYRAMSLTTTAGGFMIPTHLDPTVILTNVGTTNPFRQISRVVNVTSNVWNGVSSAGVTASWDAEAAEVSDDAPTIAQPSITCYKGMAYVPVSFEAFEDIPNLGSEVAMMFADAKDRLEGTAFATGSGSAQPFGAVAAVAATAGSRVAGTTANTYGLVDLYAVYNDLPARYEDAPSTAWVMNKAILNLTRQFATADNYNGYLFDLAPGSTGRIGRTILGYPAYTSSAMDAAIGTTDDDLIIVGDWDHYVIADRLGASTEFVPVVLSDTTTRPSGQRGWLMHWRVGADSVNDDAFRVLRI